MVISIYLSMTSLNVNALKVSTKGQRVDEWIKKKNLYAAYKRLTSELKTYTCWKLRNGKGYSMQMETKGKVS